MFHGTSDTRVWEVLNAYILLFHGLERVMIDDFKIRPGLIAGFCLGVFGLSACGTFGTSIPIQPTAEALTHWQTYTLTDSVIENQTWRETYDENGDVIYTEHDHDGDGHGDLAWAPVYNADGTYRNTRYLIPGANEWLDLSHLVIDGDVLKSTTVKVQ